MGGEGTCVCRVWIVAGAHGILAGREGDLEGPLGAALRSWYRRRGQGNESLSLLLLCRSVVACVLSCRPALGRNHSVSSPIHARVRTVGQPASQSVSSVSFLATPRQGNDSQLSPREGYNSQSAASSLTFPGGHPGRHPGSRTSGGLLADSRGLSRASSEALADFDGL
eukprot:gene14030-biopygen3597